MRIKGELPSLAVSISDGRLKNIMDLVQSIPFPESPPAPPENDLDYNVSFTCVSMLNGSVSFQLNERFLLFREFLHGFYLPQIQL